MVPLADLKTSSIPFAHLTGTAAYIFNENEVIAVRKYVESGGVLLIEACGGQNGFGAAVERQLLPQAFPMAPASDLRADHPKFKFLAGQGGDLSKPKLRPFTLERLGRGTPFPQVTEFGKGFVVYSKLDLSTALVGANTWGVYGYQPDYAMTLVKDLLLRTQTTAPR